MEEVHDNGIVLVTGGQEDNNRRTNGNDDDRDNRGEAARALSTTAVESNPKMGHGAGRRGKREKFVM